MMNRYIEVKVRGIVKTFELTPPNEVVPLELAPSFLLEDDKNRVVAINIGERFAIVNKALRGELTLYNTFISLIERLGVSINSALIYNVGEDIHAKLRFQTRLNEEIEEEVDICDAIVISILTHAPIYVDTKTMDEFSVDVSELIKG
jgi:bifunctional DNase/RNase